MSFLSQVSVVNYPVSLNNITAVDLTYMMSMSAIPVKVTARSL